MTIKLKEINLNSEEKVKIEKRENLKKLFLIQDNLIFYRKKLKNLRELIKCNDISVIDQEIENNLKELINVEIEINTLIELNSINILLE